VRAFGYAIAFASHRAVQLDEIARTDRAGVDLHFIVAELHIKQAQEIVD
jgi:hypothetical protein